MYIHMVYLRGILIWYIYGVGYTYMVYLYDYLQGICIWCIYIVYSHGILIWYIYMIYKNGIHHILLYHMLLYPYPWLRITLLER